MLGTGEACAMWAVAAVLAVAGVVAAAGVSEAVAVAGVAVATIAYALWWVFA